MDMQDRFRALPEGAVAGAASLADPLAPTLGEDLALLFVEMSVLILAFLAAFTLVFSVA